MTIMRGVIADIDPDLVGLEATTITITVDNPLRVNINCEDMPTDIIHKSDTLDRDLTMIENCTDILLTERLSNLPHSHGTNRTDQSHLRESKIIMRGTMVKNQSTMRDLTKTNVTQSLRLITKIEPIVMNGLIIRRKIVAMGIKSKILGITTSLAQVTNVSRGDICMTMTTINMKVDMGSIVGTRGITPKNLIPLSQTYSSSLVNTQMNMSAIHRKMMINTVDITVVKLSAAIGKKLVDTMTIWRDQGITMIMKMIITMQLTTDVIRDDTLLTRNDS